MKPFAIVKFPQENDSVAVVRSAWVEDDVCLWPRKSFKKALKDPNLPKREECDICPVVVLQYYDTLSEAKSQLNQATVTSDLDTGGNGTTTSQMQPPPPPTTSIFKSKLPTLVSNDALLGQSQSSGQIIETQPSVTTPASSKNGVESVTPEKASLQSRMDMMESLLHTAVGKLESLTIKVDEMTEMLSLITNQIAALQNCRSVALEPPGGDNLKNIFDLPLTSKDQLDKLNAFLSQEENMNTLKRFLTGTGGTKLDDAVQRVMGKLLDDNLSVQYSLKGKRGKLSFAAYSRIIESVEVCVRQFPSLGLLASSGQLDSKSFESAFGSFFKKVSDRVSQRVKKAAAEVPILVVALEIQLSWNYF